MLPLEGIRVLDLTTLSGYCGMELADYGAEVIKIEAPCDGDPLRTLVPLKNGTSVNHVFRDRGKKSVTLDLWHPEGKEIFQKLVATADAVLENFTPGTLEAIGLGYEDMAAIKPSIVYGRITAYGSTGEQTKVAQKDLLAQAKGGSMHVTGFPENEPTRIGFSMAERYSSSFLSTGVCLAIYQARSTGEGQVVETTYCGSVVAITEDKVVTYSATKEDPMRTGNAHTSINPYDIIQCKDGYIAMGISSDDQWGRFCDAFGRLDWKISEKYCSNSVRGLNYFGDLRNKIEELFLQHTMQEIADTCDNVLIPGTMCSTTKEALQEPQLHERNMIVTVADENVGNLQMPGKPVKFVGESEEALVRSPKLGEHNAEVYDLLSIDSAKRAQLQRDGVI